MGVEVVITQKCDIGGCQFEEVIAAEGDAATMEVMGEKLVLCEKHRRQAEELNALLADTKKMKTYLFDLWRNRNSEWQRMNL